MRRLFFFAREALPLATIALAAATLWFDTLPRAAALIARGTP